MKTEVYHNARCSKSRQALAVLRKTDIEPEIVRHLDTPPTKDELRPLVEAAGLNAIDTVRTKEAEFKELGLSKESNDEELLDAMVSHPRLVGCPFVITGKGVRMTCPTETVEEILQPMLTDLFGSPIFTTKPKLNFSNNYCPTH